MRSSAVLFAASSAFLSLSAFGLATSAAGAMPLAPVPPAASLAAKKVAMGCGIGRTRDAMGRCRHRFNLFRHPQRFQAYKDRHCDRVSTPSGKVNRCRI